MNLFKDSQVNLHPIEKGFILLSTILIAFLLFMMSYVMAKELGGIHSFTGYVGCVLSPGILFTVYRTLHGKGLNK